jgi:hypothetical protein
MADNPGSMNKESEETDEAWSRLERAGDGYVNPTREGEQVNKPLWSNSSKSLAGGVMEKMFASWVSTTAIIASGASGRRDGVLILILGTGRGDRDAFILVLSCCQKWGFSFEVF